MFDWNKVYQKFMRKVEFRKNSDCWWWTGSVTKSRYGRMQINWVRYKAHRLSWMLHKGPIPDDKNVLHTCDNTKCVNPDHLYIGTQKENNIDAWDRTREKLDEDSIKLIKAMRDCGSTQEAIARYMGISQSHVQRILSGYRHMSS